MRKCLVVSLVAVVFLGAVAVAGESKQDQENRKVVDWLLDQVRTANADGRVQACSQLANVPSDERVVPTLIAASSGTNGSLVTVGPIRFGITSMGDEARQAVPLLCEALTNRSADVRWGTLLAMRQMGKAALVCTPVLEALLSDKDESVRYWSGMVLVQNERLDKGLPALREMLMHCRYVDRWCEIAGGDFRSLGGSARPCVGLMLELLRDRVNLQGGELAEKYIKAIDEGLAAMTPTEFAGVDTQLVAAVGARLRGAPNKERVQVFEKKVEAWFVAGGRDSRLRERAKPPVRRLWTCEHSETDIREALLQLDKVAARLKSPENQSGNDQREIKLWEEIGSSMHILMCAEGVSRKAAIPALQTFLSCDDEFAADQAVLAMVAIGCADNDTVVQLIRLASRYDATSNRSQFQYVARHIVECKTGLLTNAVPGLLAALSVPYSGEGEKPRSMAFKTLAQIGPQIIPAVQSVWDDLTEPNRRLLLDLVLEMGPDAVKKMELQFVLRVKQLLADTKSPDRTLRWLAAHDMGRFGIFPDMVTPALVLASKDPEWVVRAESALALGRIGRAAEVLTELAKDSDVRVAQVAAMVRGLGPNNPASDGRKQKP